MKKPMMFVLTACCLVFVLAGCTKDQIVNRYNKTLQKAGDNNLTDDSELQGNRSFGKDSYVGNYSANYDDFTGTETLFGGTALDREAGNEIEITCRLNTTGGTARLIFQSGIDDPQILIENSGDFSKTITLPSASNYILLEGNGFNGSIELEIK